MDISKSKAKGGIARAKALSPKERVEIAKRAAMARWSGDIPRATHGSPDHPLKVGDIEIPCYVLADERRVLAQREMITALGMGRGGSSKGGGDRLTIFTSGKLLEPFVNRGLRNSIEHPIKFRTTKGKLANAYDARILSDLCDAILAARRAEVLQRQQMHIADRCEILVRGFARVGIIALIDEVTGYQEIRDRQALQAILDKYLRKEFAAWAKRFPDEFYSEMFRLRGWQRSPLDMSRPQIVGHYTNNIVYERLAPGILEELQTRNPKDEKGNRKGKHHQFLTEDVGHPALAQHLYAVMGFMRASEDWEGFIRLLDKAFPMRNCLFHGSGEFFDAKTTNPADGDCGDLAATGPLRYLKR